MGLVSIATMFICKILISLFQLIKRNHINQKRIRNLFLTKIETHTRCLTLILKNVQIQLIYMEGNFNKQILIRKLKVMRKMKTKKNNVIC